MPKPELQAERSRRDTMSHRSLSAPVRLVAVLVLAAIGVGVVVPAGSQQVMPREQGAGPPSLDGGTVVLHFTAENEGQKVLDVVLRCARPRFSVTANVRKPEGSRYSWRLEGQVDVVRGVKPQIRVDLARAVLSRQAEFSSLDLNVEVGAVVASGEEKVLLKADELTLSVRAEFEPAE
jgi:hypothetical protein